jgi:uncharacterized protein with PIN domain
MSISAVGSASATTSMIQPQQVSAAALKAATSDGDGRTGAAALNDGDAAAKAAAQQVSKTGSVDIRA